MITKRNFSPIKVWQYVKFQMTFVLIWSIAAWILIEIINLKFLIINFTIVGVLGSALAIFVAFRNNAAYSRWWEARTIWGGILNSSRVFARLIITFTDSHSNSANYDRNRSERFKKDIINMSIAWVHSLRLHLRNQNNFDELKKYFDDENFDKFIKSKNKPTFLQLMIGKKIYEAMSNGTLAGFDSFQLEGQLLALANFQSGCERIKNTPLPKQYDFFTRIFVYIFAFMLPLGSFTFFSSEANISWLIIPISLIVSGVFVVMERTGAANENPFENQVTDVPLTAICNTIERDLLEMSGETNLPEELLPINGYLF